MVKIRFIAVTLDPYRLPNTVSPSAYEITLAPDLESDGFDGSVTIKADVLAAVDAIVLNADALTISSASVRTVDGQELAVLDIELDTETERVTLGLPATLEVGPIEIDLAFAGTFNDQLVGLYLSTFPGEDGSEHRLATTQFEATHARKCFPCWDEPEFKATFSST